MGNRHGVSLVDHGVLGLAAAADHCHHPVSGSEAAGAGPAAQHLTGQLEAGDVGGGALRGWVEAGDLEPIGPVPACGPNRTHDLTSAAPGDREHTEQRWLGKEYVSPCKAR